MKITLSPIATVIGGRPEVSDDYWGGVRSVIRLNEDLPLDTLKGLEEFSHLEVVWHFSKGSDADVHLGARHPRNNPDWPETGTFVHRNHRRPARIAVSHPRLLSVEGRDLHVEDLDAVDGTPVYDIAPWFAEFGPRGEVNQPSWPGEMLSRYWEKRSDT
ncbi:TrmO family methyltransferase domain-containing protein [Nocardiopsis changdeensis]|uniref:TrmO family methyltransferase domain-containing protein n=1 Tax=Nocardiopsis TaxID=2013 RepID=UPI0021053CB7|nr:MULTISPECIES: TrmO family methyltransferase [Nocardiopsis]